MRAIKGSDVVINLDILGLESIEDPSLSFVYNVKGFFDIQWPQGNWG